METLKNNLECDVKTIKVDLRLSALKPYSSWDQGQMGAKYVVYQTLANFIQKKDIYGNRLEIVIYSI